MSDEIYWVYEVAIRPGELENFRAVAADLIAATKSEAGTLNYEWTLNDDETVCHIYERYQNSAAALVHIGAFSIFAERFIKACRPTRFEVYGKANKELKTAFADSGVAYFSPMGGFKRQTSPTGLI
jgi:quinol monooxygenase YgiN